ncbi:hypothetical protein TNIN_448281 [Trichonephila inaurata madagascariensis]|uniref:Uncharacterized protein n=1 Tax=Trichonephila inaurata madagascariensis TaxID=2747483 RepID=A0A8X6XVT7_9ARAC|nr:hypothetical protein TNIN_448281 [Trichonephila inaurata madagascariensis]
MEVNNRGGALEWHARISPPFICVFFESLHAMVTALSEGAVSLASSGKSRGLTGILLSNCRTGLGISTRRSLASRRRRALPVCAVEDGFAAGVCVV